MLSDHSISKITMTPPGSSADFQTSSLHTFRNIHTRRLLKNRKSKYSNRQKSEMRPVPVQCQKVTHFREDFAFFVLFVSFCNPFGCGSAALCPCVRIQLFVDGSRIAIKNCELLEAWREAWRSRVGKLHGVLGPKLSLILK